MEDTHEDVTYGEVKLFVFWPAANSRSSDSSFVWVGTCNSNFNNLFTWHGD